MPTLLRNLQTAQQIGRRSRAAASHHQLNWPGPAPQWAEVGDRPRDDSQQLLPIERQAATWVVVGHHDRTRRHRNRHPGLMVLPQVGAGEIHQPGHQLALSLLRTHLEVVEIKAFTHH